ncbi:YdcH family protein [Litorimonas sp. RW-G-Af-16]|uniref:YdcH family protein n=1 Tax=Litorimonas sp. RW-G-Af-16 TaxID=3241168 RepID=UPI00390CABF8
MALSARLETLHNRHSNLDSQIEQELRHPAPDNLRLAELKKQKLHLKETIAELEGQ